MQIAMLLINWQAFKKVSSYIAINTIASVLKRWTQFTDVERANPLNYDHI